MPAHESGLSHLDHEGRVRMVDVGDKAITTRTATASGVFRTTPAVARAIRDDALGKADVLATARLAGIGGAKRTSELIPLCHQIPLDSVKLAFDTDDEAGTVTVTATARTTGRTGVEMEALTAVTVAGLTLHDMVKAVDPRATMDAVRLLTKTGGKHGHWDRDRPDADADPAANPTADACVLVVSTGAAAGTGADTTGPRIADWLREHGFATVRQVLAPDDDVATALTEEVRRGPRLLVTTGGTGVSPDDHTPEATRPHLSTELPGVAEALRARGLAHTPTAALSRGLVGFAGPTLVVNLPGSPGGVDDGLEVLDELLEHLLRVHDGTARHGDHR